jgi:putative hydrolase of the HAD superfamily
VLFDLYNTLIAIQTVEDDPGVWAQLELFLSYSGAHANPGTLHDDFRRRIRAQQQASGQEYPEIDMVAIFRGILADLCHPNPDTLALSVMQLFRALTMRHIGLFADTLPALDALRPSVKLALVSDAQRAWLEPEMRRVGLDGIFDIRIVSSDYGYRKPDPRLFRQALAQLGVQPDEAVFIGDSPYRDVCGAQAVGMRGCLVTRHAPFEPQDRLCTPDLIFQTLIEFVRWIDADAPFEGAIIAQQPGVGS